MIYEPKVVQEYLNEILKTYLDAEGWCEVDDSLKAQAGDTVEIFRYSDTGSAEKVARGEGNNYYSDIDGRSYEFKVGTAQDRVALYDEDIQKNPTVANMKMKVAPAHIVNAIKADIVNQWYNTPNTFAVTSTSGLPTVAEIIMAQSDLDLGVDNGINGGADNVCLFFSPKDYRKFQAYLVSENVIVGSEIIKGVKYTTACGIPFRASELVLDGSPVMATDKAVRLLHSNCKNTEAEREANIRRTTYYARDCYVAGLEFEKKALVMGTSVTITKTAPSNGSFDVPATSVANARVQISNIVPATGYKVGTITVTDGDSQAVTVDANNGFVCPASGATVAVSFEAI